MATRASKTASSSNAGEHRFFQLWALVAFLLVLVGFAPTWFARSAMGTDEMLPLTPLVWLHGLIFTGWLLLYVTQVSLIGTGNRTRHMALGKASLFFLFALPAIGLLASFHGAARAAGPPVFPSDSFLLLPLVNAIVFPWFVWMGWKHRFDAYTHKRFMTLVTAMMIQPASGRAVNGPIGLVAIPVAMVLAIAAFDMLTRRGVGKAVALGYIVAIAAIVGPLLVWSSEAWLGVSYWLMDGWTRLAG